GGAGGGRGRGRGGWGRRAGWGPPHPSNGGGRDGRGAGPGRGRSRVPGSISVLRVRRGRSAASRRARGGPRGVREGRVVCAGGPESPAPDRSVARPPRGASRRVIGIPRGAAELDHPTAIVIGPPRVSLRSWTL